MSMSKLIVTGCSGFIGRSLVPALIEQGFSVLGIDLHPLSIVKPRFTFRSVDIVDSISLRDAFVDYDPKFVLHLAARTDLDEKQDLSKYSANTDGVRNLIHAIQSTPSVKRCIFTSSQLVCRVGYVPVDEHDYCPNTLYGQSKVLTEKIVRENNGGGVEWCIVRPTTVWGPGMSLHYRRFLRMIQKGQYFHIGSELLHKSYSYVGNIVHQYITLLNAPTEALHKKTFYLADYTPLSLKEWANTFQREFNAPKIPTYPLVAAKSAALIGDLFNMIGIKKFPFNSFRLNNVLTEYKFDLSETEAVCGPLPYSMEHGVRDTAKWYLSLTD